jgi:hypothetical protein
MTEEQTTMLENVLACEGVDAQAAAFAELPRADRGAIFFNLPDPELRKKARAIVEARRGVSRGEKGELILSDEALIAKRDRIAGKIKEIEETRLTSLKEVLAETEAEIASRGIGESNQA